MAFGETLLTFLPNSVLYIINNNASSASILQGSNNGQIKQTFDSVSTTNRLALFYNNINAGGNSAWYFASIVPRHYGGNGILIGGTLAFDKTNTYTDNPFLVNFGAVFERLDSLDAAVNIDKPNWSAVTSNQQGFSGLSNMEIVQFTMYIPNTNLGGITAGDYFRWCFTVNNNSNSFSIYSYLLNLTLTEWT